jgi:hypothetical protein
VSLPGILQAHADRGTVLRRSRWATVGAPPASRGAWLDSFDAPPRCADRLPALSRA